MDKRPFWQWLREELGIDTSTDALVVIGIAAAAAAVAFVGTVAASIAGR